MDSLSFDDFAAWVNCDSNDAHSSACPSPVPAWDVADVLRLDETSRHYDPHVGACVLTSDDSSARVDVAVDEQAWDSVVEDVMMSSAVFGDDWTLPRNDEPAPRGMSASARASRPAVMKGRSTRQHYVAPRGADEDVYGEQQARRDDMSMHSASSLTALRGASCKATEDEMWLPLVTHVFHMSTHERNAVFRDYNLSAADREAAMRALRRAKNRQHQRNTYHNKHRPSSTQVHTNQTTEGTNLINQITTNNNTSGGPCTTLGSCNGNGARDSSSVTTSLTCNVHEQAGNTGSEDIQTEIARLRAESARLQGKVARLEALLAARTPTHTHGVSE